MQKVIIFDFNRTLYDPDSHQLFDGVPKLLKNLQENGFLLVLYGKGDQKRRELISKLDIEQYFEEVIITEEKSIAEMRRIKNRYSPARFVAVGDRVKKEIKLANQLGMETVWFRNGKFKDEIPEAEDEKPGSVFDNFFSLLDEISTFIDPHN